MEDAKGSAMAGITICNLDDDVKTRLRVRAIEHVPPNTPGRGSADQSIGPDFVNRTGNASAQRTIASVTLQP